MLVSSPILAGCLLLDNFCVTLRNGDPIRYET